MTLLSKIKEFLSTGYKWILIIIGIAIVIEIIWAFKSLGGNVPINVLPDAQTAVSTQTLPASIILSVPRTFVQVGEKIPVSINISSVRATDGTDVILNFDPKLLTASKSTEVGKVYEEYPLNNADNTLGKVSVSGVSSAIAGKEARGLFGIVTFTAKAPGKAIISVDFTKGSTTDSNIIETKTAKDLLGKVQNVEVEIK